MDVGCEFWAYMLISSCDCRHLAHYQSALSRDQIYRSEELVPPVDENEKSVREGKPFLLHLPSGANQQQDRLLLPYGSCSGSTG